MATFLLLWKELGSTVEADCKKLRADAEANYEPERQAGIKIQSQVRMYFDRKAYRSKIRSCLFVQRVFRGHMGRLFSIKEHKAKENFEKASIYQCYASMIQTVYRGFYSRRYIHDFTARKKYIQTILEKSGELRQQLAANREKLAREEEERRLESSKKSFKKLAQSLHHLVSTKSCPGVYNSPYALEGKPTAFGIPVETHLRENTKECLRKEGLRVSRPTRKRNKLSLQAQAKYDAAVEAERAESRMSKTMRMSDRDFIAGGRGSLDAPSNYVQGISHGTKYIEPWRIAQSSRNKPRTAPYQAPFYTSVKKNAIFDHLADEEHDRHDSLHSSQGMSEYRKLPTSAHTALI